MRDPHSGRQVSLLRVGASFCELCAPSMTSFSAVKRIRQKAGDKTMRSLTLSLSLLSSLPLPFSVSLSLSPITARHPQASCRLSALFLSSFSRLALLCFPLLCIALLCFALLCFTLLCYALVLRTTEATEASSPSRRHSDESYKRNHRQNRSPLQHHKTERKLEGCPAVQH